MPLSPALDSAGNVYFLDWLGGRVRKADASTGVIQTVAGGGMDEGDGVLATQAQIGALGMTVDAAGNLYIANLNASNARIRKVDAAAATPHISTVAGNGTLASSGDGGPATSAALSINNRAELSLDPAGNLYFPEYNGARIRKVTATAAPVPADGNSHPVTISNIGNTPLTISTGIPDCRINSAVSTRICIAMHAF
jgi:hypothetical protein